MPKKDAISQYLAEIGSKGGKIGGAAKVPKGIAMLSPEERSKRAKEAAAKRWGKKTTAKKAARKKTK